MIDQSLQASNSTLISKFGPKLYLCYQDRGTGLLSYRHYYVTDQTCFIEFGSGNVSNNKVTVHCIPKDNGIVEAEFENSEKVKKRMMAVAGATNYSLALRNCEHVAHFIKSGHWICLQMNGFRRKVSLKMVKMFNRSINALPQELCDNCTFETLHSGDIDSWDFKSRDQKTRKLNKNGHNILVLGSKGSGKTTIVSQLLNRKVPLNGPLGEQQSWIYSAKGLINQANGQSKSIQEIHLIDTIGKLMLLFSNWRDYFTVKWNKKESFCKMFL